MIKLSNLIVEKTTEDTVEGTATARDQAHHLGLTYAGYGKWHDASGKHVATTIKGHLVRVEPGEEEQPQEKQQHPQEHPAISPTANPQGQEKPERGFHQHPQQSKYNDPYNSIPADWESEATTMERLDPYELRRKIHPQEQAEIVDKNVMNAFFNAAEYSSRHAQASEQLMTEEAKKQSETWRRSLHSSGDYYNLLQVQTWWQNAGAYSAPRSDKEHNNARLNKIIRDAKELPKTRAMLPIERGMTLHHKDAEKFLEAFEIGKDADLPYSGFSSDPSLARQFAVPTMAQNVGVVIRIRPNENNEIYGIHLSGVVPDYDDDEDSTIQDFAETTQQYDEEKEIIRIPQAKARCRSIKKMMSHVDTTQGAYGLINHEYLKTVYVIDMDEMGPEQQQNETSDDTHRHMTAHNPVFEFYMNNAFRQEIKKEQAKTYEIKSFIKKVIVETTKELLQEDESDPAEKAHQLNLFYKGYGKWGDPSTGKSVAKTVGSNLIKIEPKLPQYPTRPLPASIENPETDKQVQSLQPPESKVKAVPIPPIDASDPTKAVIWTNEPLGVTELNGIPFTPWIDAPKSIEEWAQVDGTLDMEEPPLKNTNNKKVGAGVVIIEPDGRIWIVEPTNHFGGYHHTFPKGGWEKGLNLQQTAIKEAFEESGLKVQITGFHSDSEGDTTMNRYYTAKRVGGTPEAHGWETQAVKLVPPEELKNYPRRDKKKLGNVATAHNMLHQKLGPQMGTNAGGLYRGKDGVDRYIKFYKDPVRPESEMLANNFYRDIGIASPNSNTFIVDKHQIGFSSDIIPGKELNEVPLTPELARKILSGFIGDIMTANYDAVGLNHDNIIVDEQGTPIRIDQGGAFLHRAMESSGRKKEEMLDAISEWDGLQNPQINPAYAKIFQAANVYPEDMLPEMIEQITKIHKLRKKYGDWKNYIRASSPYLPKKETARIAQMMDARENLIIRKLIELRDKQAKKQEETLHKFGNLVLETFGKLLLEFTAAEQAHMLGLTSKGGAYWADASGKTVAKTQDDYLISVDPEEAGEVDSYTSSHDNPSDDYDEPIDYKEPVKPQPVDALKKKPINSIMATKVGDMAGTNPGGTYVGEDGVKRYVKLYKDPTRAYTEDFADGLYRDLGIAVPKTQTFQNGPTKIGFASDIIDGVELNQVPLTQQLADQILDGFVADVLMANRDVIGPSYNNIIVGKDGTPYRIDQGGSFFLKGLETNGTKPNSELYSIPEFEGFRTMNPHYAQIFKAAKVTENDMISSLDKQYDNITKLVQKYGNWTNYVEQKVPNMEAKGKHLLTAMLNNRYTLLGVKIADLKKSKGLV
jgi:ADP-ribose pyrophosphatase YjhB (NUDIX family)